MKLRTTIKPHYKRWVLFKGTILAGLGAILLLFAGTFINVSVLSHWGWIIFLLSLSLMALGMVPYRRLTRLETQPDELILYEDRSLIYNKRGKQLFSIPLDNIEKLAYDNSAFHYGIQVWLKPHTNEKIVVLNANFDMATYLQKSKRHHSCDLFFPLFSERSYQSLQQSFE